MPAIVVGTPKGTEMKQLGLEILKIIRDEVALLAKLVSAGIFAGLLVGALLDL